MSAALAEPRWEPQPAADPRRLLGGPDLAGGPESLAHHEHRLGPRPSGGSWLVEVLRQSGLTGKGGAGFPAWRKWAAVAELVRRRPVVVVNGSEGEPLSQKDAVLLETRPHLVLDGAALAAESVGAGDVFVYLSEGRPARRRAVRRALRERRGAGLRDPRVHLVATEHRYVAGESSAAAQRISGGPAKPRFTPPRTSERGALGRPTLVQNVETLAHAALIARNGAAWFRELGTDASPGTTLMTVLGDVRRPGVYEVDLALCLAEVFALAGGTRSRPAGALLGGYFGSWLPADGLEATRLDAHLLRARHGASIGCGVLAVLPAGGCALAECSRILDYLARETAGQCGPCVNGLPALARTLSKVAASQATAADVERLRRWARMIDGRGACSHPDGAVRQLTSVLDAFGEHVGAHLEGRCAGPRAVGFPAPPRQGWWRWRS